MPNKNVLLIVVDQWRGDHVPHILRANGQMPVLRTPNLDRLCAEGTTFSNHVTTTVPCGPARASLLTGLYQMNHRACQNTIPLDGRHDTLPRALRRAGYEPALVGYTTTGPDPRTTGPADPRFTVLGDVMDGWRPVGEFGPAHDAYFGWLAQQGFPLPPNRDDIWLPEGEDAVPGATDRPARIPKELSDSAYFTERALTYLKGRNGLPFFLHLGYYRPHPPFVASAPYHAMYRPADMAPPVRASSAIAEAEQHPLLRFYLESSRNRGFFQGAEGMVCRPRRSRDPADACHLLRHDDRDRRPARPRDRVAGRDRPVGRDAGRVHLRPRGATGRPPSAGQGRLISTRVFVSRW